MVGHSVILSKLSLSPDSYLRPPWTTGRPRTLKAMLYLLSHTVKLFAFLIPYGHLNFPNPTVTHIPTISPNTYLLPETYSLSIPRK